MSLSLKVGQTQEGLCTVASPAFADLKQPVLNWPPPSHMCVDMDTACVSSSLTGRRGLEGPGGLPE